MGNRNMMCIVKKHGREFNTLLFSYVGIKNETLVKFLQLISPILYVINMFFAILFTIIKFIISCSKCIIKPKFIAKNYDEIFLNFTYMFLERTKAAGLYEKSRYWVIGPNIDSAFIPKDKEIIDYRKTITFCDNFIILKLSFNTIWNYFLYESNLCLVHKVWQFYEVQIALVKIATNSTIYFANQSDKYANLLDALPTGPKILLQHGIALNWDKLPCPLNNINTFYAISNQTWQDAFENILTNSPDIKFFNSTIQLSDLKNKRKSVLIISNVEYYNQEVEMLKALMNIDMEVYLKRHPGFTNDQCYRDLQKKYKFNYLTDKIFPKVDFVISYFSTLAFEYMTYDISVYIYNTKEEYNSEKMIEKIKKCVKI